MFFRPWGTSLNYSAGKIFYLSNNLYIARRGASNKVRSGERPPEGAIISTNQNLITECSFGRINEISVGNFRVRKLAPRPQLGRNLRPPEAAVRPVRPVRRRRRR
ncbi:hypothetical protein EVAR_54892_1 [Eumeta japonica]|uniref:Uncharacterized protein n=1 Tax=Eumeta variegata TaxID=151549 RepID=A0A4C2A119_EUMVA|nr:hypothetical protein EVAR_54892_1 [Eumeta japonica]